MFRKRVKDWKSYTESLEQPAIELDKRTTARLYFLNIEENTLELVKKAGKLLENNLEEITNRILADIFKEGHLEELIASTIGKEAYKQALHNYIKQFFIGEINTDYIKSRVKIGLAHSRRSVTANFFTMAHQRLFQYVKTILMQKLHRRPNEMIEILIAIEKLASYDQQLIIDVYYEDTFRGFLEDISHMLNEMTGLDTTEQLIESMNKQIAEIHNVTAATEQMSSSIQEVSDHSIRVAEGTEDAVTAAEHSREVISSALDDISQVGEVYEVVLEEVNTLAKAIDNTQNI